MAIPEPQLGLVIPYTYLWHHEYRAGNEEGRKNRPCVIVLAAASTDADITLVSVVPVTHSKPADLSLAVELPAAVKRHLGLDPERSWVILDEINEFAWPGFDLRPLPGSRDQFAYGFLPPRLFNQIMATLREVWSRGRSRRTARD
ncbi:MAG TPA: type II toxin-antitoxin system PemK/MazF family toxin [Rhodopila sp.]|uniref:type II toxin-antitoxin system PemK/MazF family toxin n=1 Tax=Rhodopila sp. TaxID=2480087 RepID=UPI002C090FFE|nr:type II toxin-antitoxin system PemK/MazF family toxin [Rhodopila sp.]HVY14630.1 type II toxin-antitoxin system PemK/MazF family toxin [Rhodopila sp.]